MVSGAFAGAGLKPASMLGAGTRVKGLRGTQDFPDDPGEPGNPGEQEARCTRIAAEGTLPVPAELAGLFPLGALRRGSTVAVHGSSALLLALLAEATSDGSWAAVVGMPDLGLVAAGDLGVELDRLAVVSRPGAEFAAVTAALLDGMALVAVDTRPEVRTAARPVPQLARRLSARARHRGAVLLSFGPWPGAEIELTCVAARWSGLADEYERLLARTVTVRAGGRGAASRPVRTDLSLPGPAGAVAGVHTGDVRGTTVRRVG